jgi:hypothetical protein
MLNERVISNAAIIDLNNQLEKVKAQLEQAIDIADDLADSLSEFLPESTSCDCEECIDVSRYHERIKKLDQFKEELKA